jgi:uncharacterized protein
VSLYEGIVEGEHRYRILGLVEGMVILFVVFADREVGLGDHVTRIISARRADRSERQTYEEERKKSRHQV